MKAFALFLSPLLLALAPTPIESGRVLLHTTIHNEWVDLYPTDTGLTYVRIVGGPWSVVATDLLDELSGNQPATVGTTFCVTTLVHMPGGGTYWVDTKVEVDEYAPSLEGAVAKAKDSIKAALPSGTYVTPCPVDSKL